MRLGSGSNANAWQPRRSEVGAATTLFSFSSALPARFAGPLLRLRPESGTQMPGSRAAVAVRHHQYNVTSGDEGWQDAVQVGSALGTRASRCRLGGGWAMRGRSWCPQAAGAAQALLTPVAGGATSVAALWHATAGAARSKGWGRRCRPLAGLLPFIRRTGRAWCRKGSRHGGPPPVCQGLWQGCVLAQLCRRCEGGGVGGEELAKDAERIHPASFIIAFTGVCAPSARQLLGTGHRPEDAGQGCW